MTPEPDRRSSQAAPGGVSEDATLAAREAADARKDDASMRVGTAAEDIHRKEGDATPRDALRVAKPRRGRPSQPAKSRRMGLFEYTLFALIAIGISITVVMTILNPS